MVQQTQTPVPSIHCKPLLLLESSWQLQTSAAHSNHARDYLRHLTLTLWEAIMLLSCWAQLVCLSQSLLYTCFMFLPGLWVLEAVSEFWLFASFVLLLPLFILLHCLFMSVENGCEYLLQYHIYHKNLVEPSPTGWMWMCFMLYQPFGTAHEWVKLLPIFMTSSSTMLSWSLPTCCTSISIPQMIFWGS